MRPPAYRLFEIVAWPAAAWFAMEALLRLGTGDPAGGALAAGWALLAAGVVGASRARAAAIATNH